MQPTVPWGTVARIAARVLLAGILGLVAFALSVLIVIPRATHGTALTVLTGSMTPNIPVGSVVIDRPVDPGTLHVGDIATYQEAPGKAEYITHRIVKIDTSKSPTQFTFKGDANRGPDIKLVPATAIRGKVWFHIPYLGGIRDAIQTKGGLAGVAMVLLAGYALFQVAGAYKDRRNTKAADTPDDHATITTAAGSEVDLAIVRQRLTTLTSLASEEIERLRPHALVQLLGGAFLNADDETFAMRVAELTACEPSDTPAPALNDQASTPVVAKRGPRAEHYPVPLYALPQDSGQSYVDAARAAGLKPALAYALPLTAVPTDMHPDNSPPPAATPPAAAAPTTSDVEADDGEAWPFVTTPLDALRSATLRSQGSVEAVPDVYGADDVRPVRCGDQSWQDAVERDEEHARV